MTESALKDVKIPIFNGKRGDFRSWQASLMDAFFLKQVHPTEWARLTRAHVRDLARDFLLMHDPNMEWDFQMMMQALHREFQLEDPTSAVINFNNMYQKDNEPVAKFLDRLERSYYDAYPTTQAGDPIRHRALCVQALQGVKPEIRDRISATATTLPYNAFKEQLKCEEAFLAAFYQGRAKRATSGFPGGQPRLPPPRGIIKSPKVSFSVNEITEEERNQLVDAVIKKIQPQFYDMNTTLHAMVDEFRQHFYRQEDHPNLVGERSPSPRNGPNNRDSSPQAESGPYENSGPAFRSNNRPRNDPRSDNNFLEQHPGCYYCGKKGHFKRECKQYLDRYGYPAPVQSIQTDVTLKDELTNVVNLELRDAQEVDPFDPVQPFHPLNSRRPKNIHKNFPMVASVNHIYIRETPPRPPVVEGMADDEGEILAEPLPEEPQADPQDVEGKPDFGQGEEHPPDPPSEAQLKKAPILPTFIDTGVAPGVTFWVPVKGVDRIPEHVMRKIRRKRNADPPRFCSRASSPGGQHGPCHADK